jgi:parvulin-like peptidyl-prolyl isomerase
VAFSLPAGGVSEVLDTQFGVNLLKVDQREEAGSVALTDVELDIEKLLREKAADEKYKTWLADLRKRSRVRVFLR